MVSHLLKGGYKYKMLPVLAWVYTLNSVLKLWLVLSYGSSGRVTVPSTMMTAASQRTLSPKCFDWYWRQGGRIVGVRGQTLAWHHCCSTEAHPSWLQDIQPWATSIESRQRGKVSCNDDADETGWSQILWWPDSGNNGCPQYCRFVSCLDFTM